MECGLSDETLIFVEEKAGLIASCIYLKNYKTEMFIPHGLV